MAFPLQDPPLNQVTKVRWHVLGERVDADSDMPTVTPFPLYPLYSLLLSTAHPPLPSPQPLARLPLNQVLRTRWPVLGERVDPGSDMPTTIVLPPPYSPRPPLSPLLPPTPFYCSPPPTPQPLARLPLNQPLARIPFPHHRSPSTLLTFTNPTPLYFPLHPSTPLHRSPQPLARIPFKQVSRSRWHVLGERMDPESDMPTVIQINGRGFLERPTEILKNVSAAGVLTLPSLPSVCCASKQGAVETWRIFNPSADTPPIHLHLVQHRPFISVPLTCLPFPPYPSCGSKQGAVEIWHIINPSADSHPIHLHLVQHRPFARRPGDGKPFSFDPSQGPGYVWHCHILEHEDNDMMRPLLVRK
ncbi:unnamed protein product [Closterium sp. NIES-64]|nr:unnamed protein product [Closterium sp. NIES-64]